MTEQIEKIRKTIEPLRQEIMNHKVYSVIKDIDDLKVFMQYHVYAVWDFMSLLKALQSKLTCTSTPWFPSKNPETRYLINEIVLAEETDLTLDGRRQSHYEMYLEAMEASGANTSEIKDFLIEINSLHNIFVAIKKSQLHPKIKDFLDFTFKVIDEGKTHEIAAAFTFGREDLIPSMFTEILRNFQTNFPETDLSKLIYYFERHIEIDSDEHGPMAMKMISELCKTDAQKWREVQAISKLALEKRIGLWDAIEEQITLKTEMV